MRPLIQLTGYLNYYRWRVLAAILVGTGTILAGVGLLSSSGYLISAAALQPPILDLLMVIVAVRFFGISRAAMRYGERFLSHDITFRLLLRFRSYFFRVLSILPASSLKGFRSGSLLSTLTSDIDDLQNYYVRVFSPVLIAIIVTVVASLFLYSFSPPAASVTLAMLVLNGAGVPLLMQRLARGIGQKQIALRSRMHELWVEQVQGAEEIRLFGLQNQKQRKNEYYAEQIKYLEQKQSLLTGFQDTLSHGMMYFAVLVSLIVTVPLVIEGALDGVYLALVLLGVMGAFEATQNLGTAFQYLENSRKAADNLFHIAEPKSDAERQFSLDDTESDPTGLQEEKIDTQAINFSNVTFGYDEIRVLDKIDFSIPPGSKVAIVGPTGCGKSTIVNLILRFYDPDEGRIHFHGKHINEIPESVVRSAVTVVDQNTYLFNDALRNNLLPACPEATDGQMISALRQAGMGDWLSQHGSGLDTVIGEQGVSVSGGERQRLALTRAILKKAETWILDEPTANLDTVSEKNIMNTIKDITRGRTVLWITHRLVEMKRFHKILVMYDGKIVQQGDHHSLMKQRGWYHSMFSIQKDVMSDDRDTTGAGT